LTLHLPYAPDYCGQDSQQGQDIQQARSRSGRVEEASMIIPDRFSANRSANENLRLGGRLNLRIQADDWRFRVQRIQVRQ
jgi:hypothetical protein